MKLDKDIEEIRAKVQTLNQAERKALGDEIGFPLDSLNKFARGAVYDVRYTRLQKLWPKIKSIKID